jgi:tyrosine-specific transport protein
MKNLVKTMQNGIDIIHSIFLITGTAVGAGMIALPVATSEAGVLGSIFLYVICWFFSVCSGLFFVEGLAWMQKKGNLLSLSKEFLGWTGYFVVGFFYVLFFYSLLIVYISGSSSIIQSALPSIFPAWLAPAVISIIIAHVVYLGMRGVSRVNLHLMLGLITTFIGFLWVGSEEFKFEFLYKGSIVQSLSAIPLVFTAFTYQGIIPSIYYFLERDKKRTKICIWIGATIPLVGYILWDILIKGVIPLHGPDSLGEAKLLGQSLMEPLSYLLPGSSIEILGIWFAFFALVTSFLGVTLSLVDFLYDALEWDDTTSNRTLIILLVTIPPTLVAIINPNMFLFLIGAIGALFCAVLFSLVPALIVAKGKYVHGYELGSRLLTHWAPLILFFILCFLVIFFELNDLATSFFL